MISKWLYFWLIAQAVISSNSPIFVDQTPGIALMRPQDLCQGGNTQEFVLIGFYGFPIKWDIPLALESNSLPLDGADFSEVHEICFPVTPLPPKFLRPAERPPRSVGVKVIEHDLINPLELQARFFLGSERLGPSFYGCQFDVKRNQYYLVHGLLDYNLADDEAFRFVQSLHPSIRWRLYQSWVIQIAELAKVGFIHNDICRENIFIDQTGLKTFIGEFGETKKIGTLLGFGGHAFMWSPGKGKESDQLAGMVDDLFSLGLLIASIEAQKPFLTIFIPEGSDQVNQGCKLEKTKECHKMIVENVREIFHGASVPQEYTGQKATRSQTNLVGLILQALEYHAFDFTPEEVLAISRNFVFEEKQISTKESVKSPSLPPRKGLVCEEAPKIIQLESGKSFEEDTTWSKVQVDETLTEFEKSQDLFGRDPFNI